jgi:hypothetical protein
MKSRAASALLCIALLLPVLTSPALAGPWSLAPGEHYSEFRPSVFVAGDYYDADGIKRALLGGGQIEEHSLLSYTELGWKKRLTFVLGIPAKSVTRRFRAGADTSYRPTATGLADGLVGLRYGLANGRTALALEIDWKPPLGYERNLFLGHRDSVNAGDRNGDGDSLDMNLARQLGSPTLGEGQQDLTFALHLGTALSFGFFQVAGGYRYRFEDPADQIVASADLGIWVKRSWLIAGRYEGEFAAADADRPTDEVDRQRAGPFVVYRVDDRMDLIAASLHTLAATNALNTHEFFVGVAFKNTRLDRLQGFLGGSKAP